MRDICIVLAKPFRPLFVANLSGKAQWKRISHHVAPLPKSRRFLCDAERSALLLPAQRSVQECAEADACLGQALSHGREMLR